MFLPQIELSGHFSGLLGLLWGQMNYGANKGQLSSKSIIPGHWNFLQQCLKDDQKKKN